MIIGTLMKAKRIKLKQGRGVLQVPPKDLQNLVQFGVVKPKRSEGKYVFDANTLLTAKVALYLKDSLGTRSSVLSKLMDAFSSSEEELKTENPTYVVFKFRLFAEQKPFNLGLPFRSYAKKIKERV